MNFIETAMISVSPEISKSLLDNLFEKNGEVLGVPVYRFEIDADTVAMVYDLVNAPNLPEELLHHLLPHLHSVLIATDAGKNNLSVAHREKMDRLCHKFAGIPTTVAVLTEPKQIKKLTIPVLNGLFLAENSRIFLWHPDFPALKQHLWESLWLEKATGQTEDTTS